MDAFAMIYNVFIFCAIMALFGKLRVGIALLLLAFTPAVIYSLFLPREEFHMLFERVDPYGGMWVTFWLSLLYLLYIAGWFRKEHIA